MGLLAPGSWSVVIQYPMAAVQSLVGGGLAHVELLAHDWDVLPLFGFSARSRTGELGTFLLHTNHLRMDGLQYVRQRVGLLCASWRDLSSKAVDLSGSTCLTMLRFSKEENNVVIISMRK